MYTSSYFLGQLRPGQTLTSFESNLYCAPVYLHKTAPTDFLLMYMYVQLPLEIGYMHIHVCMGTKRGVGTCPGYYYKQNSEIGKKNFSPRQQFPTLTMQYHLVTTTNSDLEHLLDDFL